MWGYTSVEIWKGKMEHTQIVEHELTDGELFPDLYQHSYMHEVQLSNGTTQMEILEEIQPL